LIFQAHCRQFTTSYVHIAQETKLQNPLIQFYAVSCGSHLNYCRKVGVRGYPTFYKFNVTSDHDVDLEIVKSGTRGLDSSFVLSLFETIHSIEDTSEAFKAEVAGLKKTTGVAVPTVKRLGDNPFGSNQRDNKAVEMPLSGATNMMMANVKGTTEELLHREKIVDSIRRIKGDGIAQKLQAFMQTSDALPFQKMVPGGGATLRERVPLVRRTVKMTAEEELIVDTAVSFVYSLKHDVFLKGEELSETETKALRDWLILLSVSLPQEWVLTTLVDDVLRNVDQLARNPKLLDNLLQNQHIVRRNWSPSCSRNGSGFTCGFWKLLHTVSIGVAEHRGGKTLFTQTFNTFSPSETGDVIREFIANFFRCRECAAHFIASYDDCSFMRCDRLTDDAESASDAEWKEVAKWLWKFHNAVSVRVWNEKHNNGVHRPEDEIKVIWPNPVHCPTCFRDDGSWDEDAVFLELERTYWPGAEIDSRTARLLNFASQIHPPDSVRLYAFACVLLLLIGYRSASPYVKGAIYGPKRSD
jgi:hypothetical protein